MKHSKIVRIIFFFLLFVNLITNPPISAPARSTSTAQKRPKSGFGPGNANLGPRRRATGRPATPQEPFSLKTETGLALPPPNAASGCPCGGVNTHSQRQGGKTTSPGLHLCSPCQTGFIPSSGDSSLSSPTGWMNAGRASRSLWGMPGGLGIASAIEPGRGREPPLQRRCLTPAPLGA